MFDFKNICINVNNDNRPFVHIKVKDENLIGLLDSGANCSVLGKDCYDRVKKLELELYPANGYISTADSTKHFVEHSANLPIEIDGKSGELSVLLIPTLNKELILGMDFWKQFGIEPMSVCSVEETESDDDMVLRKPESVFDPHVLLQKDRERLDSIIESFPKSCKDKIGRTHLLTHSIDTGDFEPIRQKIRPISPYMLKLVDKEIERMMELDVIEQSTSAWASPLVCVPKTNGKIRICLDSRKLNSVTKKVSYPLPNINMILGQISNAKFISSVDLSDAFWQIPLHDADKEKTAFVVPGRGLYHFKVMPFGLCNASASQSRLMDVVIGVDLQPNVFVYLDDIIICSETLEEHLKLLKKISERIKEAGLTIGIAKSKFGCKNLRYLGYVLSENGIMTDSSKVKAIVEFETPKTVKQLRRFLGMSNWYRRFIQNYAEIAAPLNDALKGKPTKLKWGPEANEAFLLLKRALSEAPVLANPNYDQPFFLHTDASDIGTGSVLMQKINGEERVIAYSSQKLSPAEQKYMVTEKELLAIIHAIEKFMPYIQGVKFNVITDHSALQYLRSLKDPCGRLCRWALKLQALDFEVFHRKGKQNVVPDALSRAFGDSCVIEIPEETVKKDTCVIEIPEDVDTKDVENSNWYNKLWDKSEKHPEDYKQYRIEAGKLYKFVRTPGKDHCYSNMWKEVVPDLQKDKILKRFHDDVTAGHLGVRKTIKRIYENYFWPGLERDVRTYISACEICGANKFPNYKTKPPMGRQRLVTRPWQIISMDFLGPYPRTRHGNTMILVVTDLFSKWVEVFPTRAASSKNVVDNVRKGIFLKYGIPKYVVFDNGSHFDSREMREFLKEYDVQPWYTSVYHPQANPTERTNRNILACIRSYIRDSHTQWDERLAEVACALRTYSTASTKYTPYFLNFGREMPGISDLHVPEPLNIDMDEKCYNEHSDKLKGLKEIWRIVEKNLRSSYEQSRKYYDKDSTNIQFKIGDFVWKRNFTQSDAARKITAKFAPRYIKCKVIRKVGSSSYELENEQGKNVGVWSARNLKMCRIPLTRKSSHRDVINTV